MNRGSRRIAREWIAAWLLVLLVAGAAAGEERLRLSTTTSTEASGLLGVVLPPFEKRFGVRVEVIAVGSGKALKLAENGDVDVVLSHAPALEEAFVEAGFGVNRRDVMFNDFVVVGPPDDPAKIRGANDAASAFRALAAAGATFVSRGDESGTHQKEKEIWKKAGVSPAGDGYVSVGQGMGEVLRMADERRAYTLADRATFLAFRKKVDLAIVLEGDPSLFNPYTVIAVNPAKHPHASYLRAMELIAWLTSPEGQKRIAGFVTGGEPLYHPTAVPPRAAP